MYDSPAINSLTSIAGAIVGLALIVGPQLLMRKPRILDPDTEPCSELGE